MSEEIRNAALSEVREHGLVDREDSPPDWNEALTGATPREPILVKDPDDVRDDFYLVALRPSNPLARRGAWVMLDPETLKMREAALLNDWKAPLFPNEKDAEQVSESPLELPDGTVARFKADEVQPNLKNLIWKASAASILPYWPVKELTAPHPLTGVQIPIYITQEGEVLTSLAEDFPEIAKSHAQSEPAKPKPLPSSSPRKRNGIFTKLLALATLPLTAAVLFFLTKEEFDPGPLEKQIVELKKERDHFSSQYDYINKRYQELINSKGSEVKTLTERIVELEGEIQELIREKNRLEQKFNSLREKAVAIETKLREDLSTCEEKLRIVTKERDELKKRVADQPDLDSFKEKISDLEEEVDFHQELLNEGVMPKPDLWLSRYSKLGLQKEFERLSTQKHHTENQKDARKYKEQLKQIDMLLNPKKKP